MNMNKSTEKEARLRARLTAEAEAGRPEFSQRLHDRIMQSIREASRPRARGFAPRRMAFLLSVAGSAVAVAALLVFWLARDVDRESTAAHTPAPPAVDTGTDEAPQPDLALSPREETLTSVAPPAADRLTALVDATFTGSQWAYLDHDARLAASLVLGHLPFELPVEEVP